MTAVIDSTAALWRLVNGAEKLPFAGAHFRTGSCGTWWIVEEKSNDQVIAFVYEEAAEFVEPESSINTFRLRGYENGRFSVYGYGIFAVCRSAIVIVKGFEVFLELEGGIEL